MRPLVKLLEEDKKTINARRNEGSLQPNCRAACGAKRLSTSDYQRCRTNYCFTFRYCSWKCKHKFSQPTLAVDAWTWQRSFNSTILKWDGKDKDKKCKHKKTLLRFTKNQLKKKAPVQLLLATKVSHVRNPRSPKHLRHFHYRSAATHLQPDNMELWQRPSTVLSQLRCVHMKMQASWSLAAAKPQILTKQNCNLLGQKSKLMSLWAKGDSAWFARGKKRMKFCKNHINAKSNWSPKNLTQINRGTKPRAFHLPNEHTGHKPSPAERHPVLHRTFGHFGTPKIPKTWRDPTWIIWNRDFKMFQRLHVSKTRC